MNIEEILTSNDAHPIIADLAKRALEIKDMASKDELTANEADELLQSLDILYKVKLDNLLDEDRQNAYNILQMLKQIIQLIPTK